MAQYNLAYDLATRLGDQPDEKRKNSTCHLLKVFSMTTTTKCRHIITLILHNYFRNQYVYMYKNSRRQAYCKLFSTLGLSRFWSGNNIQVVISNLENRLALSTIIHPSKTKLKHKKQKLSFTS